MKGPSSDFEAIQTRYRQARRRAELANSALVRSLIALEFLEHISQPRYAAFSDSYFEEFIVLLVDNLKRSLSFGVLPELPLRIKALLSKIPGAAKSRREADIRILAGMCELYLLALSLLGNRAGQYKRDNSFPPGINHLHSLRADGGFAAPLTSFEGTVTRRQDEQEDVSEFGLRLMSLWRTFKKPPGPASLAFMVEKAPDEKMSYPWAYLEKIRVDIEEAPDHDFNNKTGQWRTLILDSKQLGSEFSSQCTLAVHLACRYMLKQMQLPDRDIPHIFQLSLAPGPFEYVGSSVGLSVVLAAISIISRSKPDYLEVSIHQDCGFIGAVTAKGAVQQVDEDSLRLKVKAAMASPIRKLVIPKGNAGACRKEMEESPDRELEILPVSSVDEVVKNRSVVSIRRPQPADIQDRAAAAGTIPYKMSLISLLVVVLIIFQALLPNRPSITSLEITVESLVAAGTDGRKLWEADLTPLAPECIDWRIDKTLRCDITGNGRQEWLVACSGWDPGEERFQSFLLCCTELEPIKCHQPLGADLKFADQTIKTDYTISSIIPFGRPEKRLAVVVANHRTSFPAFVTAFAGDGKKRGTYVHIGPLGSSQDQVLTYDIDGDGDSKLLLGGQNITYKKAALAVLNPADLWGTGPFQRSYDFYLMPDQRGCPQWYLLFPHSDIALEAGSAGEVKSIKAGNGKIVVETLEDRAGDSCVSYVLNRQLAEMERSENISYKDLYEQQVRLARIVPIREDEPEEKEPIQYWDGEEWSRPAIPNRFGPPDRRVYRDEGGSLHCIIDIPVNERWFSSGIYVPTGSFLTVSAEGRAKAQNDFYPAVSPIGRDPWSFSHDEPIGSDQFPHDSLVGRVGEDGTPFLVGIHCTKQVKKGGILYFVPNKTKHELLVNNSGYWKAHIIVDQPGAPQIEFFKIDLDGNSRKLLVTWSVRNAENIELQPSPSDSLPLQGSVHLDEIDPDADKLTLRAWNRNSSVTREILLPKETGPPEILELETLLKFARPSRVIKGIKYRVSDSLYLGITGLLEDLPRERGRIHVPETLVGSFQFLAANRKGFVTRDVAFHPIEPLEKTIQVPANQIWVNSGVEVLYGRRLVVTAKGMVSSSPDFLISPNGESALAPEATGNPFDDFVAPGLRRQALIGRIGRTGKPFFVGSRFDTLATDSGTLYLCINDRLCNPCFSDNSGAWQVTIKHMKW